VTTDLVLCHTGHKIGHFRYIVHSQPIVWLSTEKTRPKTTKANNTRTKWPYKHTKDSIKT